MQRTIVVGDVHGCLEELEALLEKCGHQGGDRVVFVGDLVAKGPDSQGVVQLARELGAQTVLGNHDEHLLRARAMLAAGDDDQIKPERRRIIATMTAPDWKYLEEMPLYVRLGADQHGDHEAAVVHGGCVSGVPLERQEREHLVAMRSIADDGAPSKKVEGTPWAALWTGPERLLFGHDAVRGLQEYLLATGLDTGCVYGGRLTAMLLPDWKLVWVEAQRVYTRFTRA